MTLPQRSIAVFEQVLTLAPAARGAFLDDACAGDPALRAEIEELIAADAQARGFLAAPLRGVRHDRSGERLGAYRLDGLIGSGGMGSVYRATRADNAFGKPVAIKLLMFDAGDLRRRFVLEQQILGTLVHPHIASLLDVGADANGAPYFVMEYVDGVPITRYAREHALDLRARIGLFLPILDAVQNAHSQLVVHRDIKPGNVLVDARGMPKLLDFGIAKLLGENAATGGASTRTGIGPLTPEYASPEQVRGERVGIPADIYSLGILLYELVTGARPYEIGDTSPAGIERAVCDTYPERPSSKFAAQTIAGSAGDLDAVLLKALAKTPAQRYASCAEFSADLKRWLDGSAVLAREPSRRERAARYLRRHRLGVSVAAAAIVALLVGLGIAVWQARVAYQQARIADSERNREKNVTRFLTDMLSAASPSDLGRNATVTEVLQRARINAQSATTDDETAATVQTTLAETYAAIGDTQSALECAQRALAAAQRSGNPSLVIDSEGDLGLILRDNGDLDRAQSVLNAAHANAVANGNTVQRASTALYLGQLAMTQSDLPAAERWHAAALAEMPADQSELRSAIVNGLAMVKDRNGDAKGAIALHRQSIDILRQAHKENSGDFAVTMSNLGQALDDTGDTKGAEDAYVHGLAAGIAVYGETHPRVVNAMASLAMFYVDHADAKNAQDYATRAEAAARNLPDKNIQAPYARYALARALLLDGRAREALPLFESAFDARTRIYPAGHPVVEATRSWLGLAHAETGDELAGAKLARDAYAALLSKLGENHMLTRHARDNLEKIESLQSADSH